ncbi:MAG: DNA polymerase III subunit delta' [Myxococcales bacterium]|nr:DNA polymerase III subunit delta' [Myxococcales bacterium]
MSSAPLAGFASVRGHSEILDLLRRAERHGRLASAYLFVGPPGVGKDRAARALAQRSLCVQRTFDGDACGQCGACRKVAHYQHPDLLLLQRGLKEPPRPEHPRYAETMRQWCEGAPESELSGVISVEQVRELIERMPFRPHEGGERWVIVRETERFHSGAANAFLKTLEEPPDATHFVLLTSRPSMLLPTIRSRCQTLRFGLLDEPDVRAVLAGLGLAPEAIEPIAGLADGSVGRALEFADQAQLEHRQSLVKLLRSALEQASVDTANLGGFVAAADAIHRQLKDKEIDRRDLEAALLLLGRHYRNEAVAHADHPARALVNAARATAVRETIEALDTGNNLSPQHVIQSMLVHLREIRS